MDGPGRPRALRGLVLAGLCTLLVAVGHVLAGGAVPDLAVLVVLFPLLTAAVVGVADRRRGTPATLATLAGGQGALHVLLALLHPHAAVAGPSPATMVAAHAAVTALVAVLLRQADRGSAVAGAVLRRALRRVLRGRADVAPVDVVRPVVRAAGPARPALRLALAAAPVRRGPPHAV